MRRESKHYVPILKGRAGEYSALQSVLPEDKQHITPLIEIPPIPWDFENDVPARTIDRHLSKVADQIVRSCGTESRLFVDLLWIAEDERMHTGEHPVAFVFNGLRSKHVQAIPVVGLIRSTEYVEASRHVIAQNGHGACLRLQREDLVDFGDIAQTTTDLLERLALSPNEVDLLFDLRALLPSDNARSVISMVRQLPFIQQWRTLTLAGTSFPQNLMGLPPSDCSVIHRTEWELWCSICENGQLPRAPFFGDYAISHPEPAEVDPRIMRPSASIRYTSDGCWLVLKARNLRDHGYGQFRQVCRDLMARSEYSGPHFSWGDMYIEDCAAGRVGTGNLTTWRKVGTSHHLQYVIEDLSA